MSSRIYDYLVTRLAAAAAELSQLTGEEKPSNADQGDRFAAALRRFVRARQSTLGTLVHVYEPILDQDLFHAGVMEWTEQD